MPRGFPKKDISISARVRQLLEEDSKLSCADVTDILRTEKFYPPSKNSFADAYYNERSRLNKGSKPSRNGHPKAKTVPQPEKPTAAARIRELLAENPAIEPAKAQEILNKEGFKSENLLQQFYKARKKMGNKPAARPTQPMNHAAPPKAEPVVTGPLELAVSIRKLATQVGGIASLKKVVGLCEKHGADKILDAITVTNEIGQELFAQLASQHQAVARIKDVGVNEISEVIAALSLIEAATPEQPQQD